MAEAGILLLGASGQLGSAVRRQARDRGVQIVAPVREQLDLGSDSLAQDLQQWFGLRPSAVILAAAMTAVDACETDEAAAFRINGDAPGAVALAAARAGCRLLHVSTDYVFSGVSDRPWRTGDLPAPINAYGRSKLEGERQVLAASGDICIVRTSWLYGHAERNFPLAILQRAAAGSGLAVVDDQVGSPCYAGDLAAALLDLAKAPEPLPAVLHFANSGQCSWREFAVAILRLAGWRCPVRPLTSEQALRPARRPAYSVLDCDDLEAVGIVRRPWAAALAEWMDELRVRAPHLFPTDPAGRGDGEGQ